MRFGRAAGRPQDTLYLCQLVEDPLAGRFSETDLGKTDDKWTCTPVTVYEDIAKAGYWLWKTYKWLGLLGA